MTRYQPAIRHMNGWRISTACRRSSGTSTRSVEKTPWLICTPSPVSFAEKFPCLRLLVTIWNVAITKPKAMGAMVVSTAKRASMFM